MVTGSPWQFTHRSTRTRLRAVHVYAFSTRLRIVVHGSLRIATSDPAGHGHVQQDPAGQLQPEDSAECIEINGTR